MFSIFSFSCQPIFNDSWSHNAIILICGHHHIFLYSPHNHEWQRSCYSQMGLWMFTPWIISCGNKMMWLHWVYNNKTKKQFWTTSIYSNKLSPLSFSWGPVPFHVIHQFVSNSMSHRFMFILSWTQLNRSVQAGLMWKFRSDFPSCSEFAEICHVDSFCVKNVPVFYAVKCNLTKLTTKSGCVGPRWPRSAVARWGVSSRQRSSLATASSLTYSVVHCHNSVRSIFFWEAASCRFLLGWSTKWFVRRTTACPQLL